MLGLLCWKLYLGFRVWNGHVTLAKGENCLFVSFFSLAGLQDCGMGAANGDDRDCRKAVALEFCI